jgi:hypothetical protein
MDWLSTVTMRMIILNCREIKGSYRTHQAAEVDRYGLLNNSAPMRAKNGLPITNISSEKPAVRIVALRVFPFGIPEAAKLYYTDVASSVEGSPSVT